MNPVPISTGIAFAAAALLAACASEGPARPSAPVIVSASGQIDDAVERYRRLLGADNAGAPGPQTGGRREINWDGVPDALAAPQMLPPDFFNAALAPRARGAVFSTPGLGIQVSARPGAPGTAAPRFAHLNAGYAALFKPYSGERLFSPIGSNIVDMRFVVPGTQHPAAVRGFGAVYADVNLPHTSFEYFDRHGNSLGRFQVPAAPRGHSFLGAVWDRAIVARVRIEYGTAALGPDDGPTTDVSVMDDFIYGEPQALR